RARSRARTAVTQRGPLARARALGASPIASEYSSRSLERLAQAARRVTASANPDALCGLGAKLDEARVMNARCHVGVDRPSGGLIEAEKPGDQSSLILRSL